jgi:hypothetical protein
VNHVTLGIIFILTGDTYTPRHNSANIPHTIQKSFGVLVWAKGNRSTRKFLVVVPCVLIEHTIDPGDSDEESTTEFTHKATDILVNLPEDADLGLISPHRRLQNPSIAPVLLLLLKRPIANSNSRI